MIKSNKYIGGIDRLISIILIVFLSMSILSGCKKKVDNQEPSQTQVQVQSEETEESVEEAATEGETDNQNSEVEPEPEPIEQGGESNYSATEPEEATFDASGLSEDGFYYSKEDVALYIHIYGHLPDNYMTKKEAKSLGWSGGSLEKYAPGKVIGGDRFGNYEGSLPDGKKYTECDIDTNGKKKRGAKRIVFSDDGYIYYTEDHYETFELLYEPED